MDSILEYILTDAHGFLRLRPVVPGTYGHRFPRPGAGNAYSLLVAPEHV
jgi:hypothetical protein